MNRLPDPHSRPGPTTPILSAVIVNYNAWPDVANLVASLAASPEVKRGLVEVLVVDNASDGPIPQSLESDAPNVRLILRDDNGGFAVGVNTGWRSAHAPWLLLLNPDVVAGPDLLAEVVARARRFDADRASAPGLVGFALRNEDGTPQPSVGTFPTLARTLVEQLIPRSRRKYQAVSRTQPGPVPWVTGACVLVHSGMLQTLDGLDEDFFLYYEEVALCRAARRLGWRTEFDPSIAVTHLRPLQNRPVTPRMRVITRHSKLLYFRKHLPRWQFLALCAVVAVEARLSRVVARALGRVEDARSWQTVARVEQSLRAGDPLGGRSVLALADAVETPVILPSNANNVAKRPSAPRRLAPRPRI